MKPLIAQYGGKQQIAKKIVDLLPEHHHYIEPFCGGAAVYFAKPQYGGPSNYRETLNDLNENFISLYRCLQNPKTRDQLCERLTYTPHSRIEWNLARDIYRSVDAELSDRAWATMVCYLQSFAGIGRSWGWTKGKDGRLSLKWFNRVQYAISTELRERIKYTQFECRPALELMEKMDVKNGLFYLDPPYPKTDCGEMKGNYTQKDFVDLINFCKDCKCSVVLSCYQNDAIPDEWKCFSIKTLCRTVTSRSREGGKKLHKDERIEYVFVLDRSGKKTTQEQTTFMGF